MESANVNEQGRGRRANNLANLVTNVRAVMGCNVLCVVSDIEACSREDILDKRNRRMVSDCHLLYQHRHPTHGIHRHQAVLPCATFCTAGRYF